MPEQITPPRRIKTQIERVRDDSKKTGESGTQKITVETVEAVLPGNQVQVLGVVLPVTGTGSGIVVGQRVPVGWKDNKPTAAIFHHAQAAQFVPGLGSTSGIVEEVFVAPSSDKSGKQTIWFRNFGQVTELVYAGSSSVPAGTRLYKDFTATATAVKWGVHKDVFGVLEGTAGAETIHVYRIVRSSETKITGTSGVKVKEKIGSYVLSTNGPNNICNLAIHIKRNSIESYLELFWHPTGPAGTPQAQFDFDHSQFHRDSGTNANVADVDRSITLTLTGSKSGQGANGALTFTNGSPIAASQIVVPHGIPDSSYRTDFGEWGIDENNHPIYTMKITFVDFGLWQGNSTTGLTGGYSLMGEGTLTNIGLCFIPLCPGVVDNLGIQDFMDHGNASGIISTHIYEQHIVMIDAATGTMMFKTLGSNVFLNLEESSNGADPYRFVHDIQMPASPEQCGTPNNLGPGGWRSVNPFDPALQATVDMGDIGDLALIKAEASLFDQLISFAPDLPMGNDPTISSPTRVATTRIDTNRVGYDREWTDFFGVNCSFFIAQEHVVKGMWLLHVCDVKRRYDVNVDAKPFVGADTLRWFVTVIRNAQRPNGGSQANYSGDQHQYGAFIINSAGGLLGTARDYTSLADLTAPVPTMTFITANDRHVIWRENTVPNGSTDVPWFIKDYVGGNFEQGGIKDPSSQLRLLSPDLLYAFKESKPKQQYFVLGWDRATLAFDPDFNDSNSKFPKKDGAIQTIGSLMKLPNSITISDGFDFHAIVDPIYVPTRYRDATT